MAQISFNSFLKEVHGKVGNLVVRKIGGRYYFSERPQTLDEREPTAGQVGFRKRFRQASDFARRVQRTPELHAFYAPFAKARDLRVRAIAISDWFHPPTVDAIELKGYRGKRGGVILIRATDKYGVAKV